MFETIITRKSVGRTRRRAVSLVVSLAAHASVLGAAVWLSATLAARKEPEPVSVTFFKAAPPAAPAPPATHKPVKPRTTPTKPRKPMAPLVQPKEIPKERPPENKPEEKPPEEEEDEPEGVGEEGIPSGVGQGVPGIGQGMPGGTGNEPVQTLGGGMVRPEPSSSCGTLVMPEQARTMGITGRVIMKYVVHSDGSVDPVKFQVLGQAPPVLVDAVKRWLLSCTFKPATQGGRPIAVAIIQPFNFKLE